VIAATLVVRAEPADEAALFLRGALVVEGDEAGEQGSVGSRPSSFADAGGTPTLLFKSPQP